MVVYKHPNAVTEALLEMEEPITFFYLPEPKFDWKEYWRKMRNRTLPHLRKDRAARRIAHVKYKKIQRKLDVNAGRRLYKDMRDLAKCAHEFPNVTAQPLEDNIYFWHANIMAPDGKLAGYSIHLEIQFPYNYPKAPPKLRILTPIRHPNVFGKWICLSMLRPHNKKNPHEGWSGAYSVSSILLQLQSFLFAEYIPQDYGRDQKARHQSERVLERIATYKCDRCPHTGKNPWPMYRCQIARSARADKNKRLDKHKAKKKTKDYNDYDYDSATLIISNPHEVKTVNSAQKMVNQMNPDTRELIVVEEGKEKWEEEYVPFPRACLFDLFEFLSQYEMQVVGILYPSWKQIQSRYALQAKREAICFFSKLDYTESALGFGVRVTRDPFQPTKIRELACEMDLISDHAFHGCDYKLSVWGHECHEYIPLVLSKSHARRSEKLMMKHMIKLAGKDDDEAILSAACSLMNSCIVGIMKEKGEIRMHHSEKALEGYCRFHQLLLHLCKLRPNLKAIAERNIDRFINDFRSRHKKKTPDLGKLLVQLSLTDKYSWEDINEPLFEETLTRNVLWSTKDNPLLRFDYDSREFGHWYRVYGVVKIFENPEDIFDEEKTHKKQYLDGFQIHGIPMNKDPSIIQVLTPTKGYIQISSNSGRVEAIPFRFPRVCKTNRKALGRAHRSMESRFCKTIPTNKFVVVLDIQGNRALVAYSNKQEHGLREVKQTMGRGIMTIYGALLSTPVSSKLRIQQQDCVWVSLNNSETGKCILDPVKIPDNYRLDETFRLISVSRRLLMFQRSFLRVIKGTFSVDEMYKLYMKRLGYAPDGYLERLHKECKRIKAVRTWHGYMKWIDVRFYNKSDLIELLRRCVAYSLKKRYHRAFHTQFDPIPVHRNKKGKSFISNKNVAKTFRKETPEDYVPRFNKTRRVVVPRPEPTKEFRTFRKRGGTFTREVTFLKLLISGLPTDQTPKQVKSLLKKFIGKVPLFVPRVKTGLCKGYAFAEFQNLKKADDLVKRGIPFPSGTVYPKYARPKPVKANRKNNVNPKLLKEQVPQCRSMSVSPFIEPEKQRTDSLSPLLVAKKKEGSPKKITYDCAW